MKDVDVNYKSIADVEGVHISSSRIAPDNPKDYDDILKFSNAKKCGVSNCEILGGKENAIDMNRTCNSIKVKGCVICSGGHCAVVIKGGTEDVLIDNSLFIGCLDQPYEIELGGWSDQSMAKTKGVIISECTSDIGVIRIVVGWAERPFVYNSNVKILFWRSLGLKLFCLFKYVASIF